MHFTSPYLGRITYKILGEHLRPGVIFAKKITKTCPAAGGSSPTPPLVIRMNYSHVFTQHASSNLDIFTF